MARLIYFMPTSLDGYIADETGSPDWAAPDEEVFAFIMERSIFAIKRGPDVFDRARLSLSVSAK